MNELEGSVWAVLSLNFFLVSGCRLTQKRHEQLAGASVQKFLFHPSRRFARAITTNQDDLVHRRAAECRTGKITAKHHADITSY
jgi:hypothetical protein